jgi:hypothetical protein
MTRFFTLSNPERWEREQRIELMNGNPPPPSH